MWLENRTTYEVTSIIKDYETLSLVVGTARDLKCMLLIRISAC